jgi:hypothetical protein
MAKHEMLKKVKNNCLKIWKRPKACRIFVHVFKLNKQMKKLALIFVIGAVALMSSCGPSAKEKEAKRIADSTRVADSINKVKRVADSIAKVQAAQKKVADSIAHQDSIKKHLIKPAKAVKPTKPAPKKKAHK